jgi:hypothetical protein
VGIRFSGEYWMFRWPQRRPPARSFSKRGDPSQISFHTTDGASMEMEAHQRLDPPANPKCCRKIQAGITDTDPYPGTVSLEMILVDSATGATQSLGNAMPDSQTTREQILSYSIPRVTSVRKFDEIKIVFHRDRIRKDKSAKITIERFVLLP